MTLTIFNNAFFQVSSNGLLSFRKPFIEFSPAKFPLINEILIAPFWNDVNLELAGQVSYRFSKNQSLLDAVQAHINESLNVSFPPAFLLIATWDRVARFNGDPLVVRLIMCM